MFGAGVASIAGVAQRAWSIAPSTVQCGNELLHPARADLC
jgi:hypothetical protein